MRGAVSANALPCLPATGAWHAPVTASKEELSSDSFAVLHAGQDTPAAPAPVLLRWSGFVPGIELSVQHGVELLLQALPDFFFKIILAPQMVHGEVDEQIIGDLYAFYFPILSYPRRSQRLRRLL